MGIKLVIADDAVFIREVVRNIAENAGIVVVGEAADGQEAVKVVLKTKPDVVLMDIVMPIKSGIDATIEILEKWPQARILACSTVDQDTLLLKAMEAGCCQYLTKPFESEELVKVIKSCAKQQTEAKT